ncbi:MAG: hypothetical protein M1840_001431 [Geoglossum simile]|nr:MAG: hypothetical protein M1840_001431 [Geoglossum simile]
MALILHHRHQSSLESIIDFSTQNPLLHEQRLETNAVLSKLLTHCRLANTDPRPYKWIDLLQLIQDYAVTEAGRDRFRYHILASAIGRVGPAIGRVGQQDHLAEDTADILLALADFESWSESRKKEVAERLQGLADDLINFVAFGRKTPQSNSLAPMKIAKRLYNLRANCLFRDHHRCVITRCFDLDEAIFRCDRVGSKAVDDDDELLYEDKGQLIPLEVANIIPYSLLRAKEGEKEPGDKQKYALQVLDMFDPGVVDIIDGGNIYCPCNAITLSAAMHQRFGGLEVYFERQSAGLNYPKHMYVIKATKIEPSQSPALPIERALLVTPNRTVDPPSERLLAVHRACALVLHLCGAAGYVDEVLLDKDVVPERVRPLLRGVQLAADEVVSREGDVLKGVRGGRAALSWAKGGLDGKQQEYTTRVEAAIRADAISVEEALPSILEGVQTLIAQGDQMLAVLRHIAGLPQLPHQPVTPENSDDGEEDEEEEEGAREVAKAARKMALEVALDRDSSPEAEVERHEEWEEEEEEDDEMEEYKEEEED